MPGQLAFENESLDFFHIGNEHVPFKAPCVYSEKERVRILEYVEYGMWIVESVFKFEIASVFDVQSSHEIVDVVSFSCSHIISCRSIVEKIHVV